jgi:phage N-6-adenine-methyltransferase
MTYKEIAIHEAANLFPLMKGEDYEGLKTDISINGLIEPIWTYEGKIIDGRNRYRACLELGVEPTFREWSGEGSLTSFVLSLNLKRRHLNSGQRAMIAVDVAALFEAEAKERQRASGGDRKSVQYKVSVPEKFPEPIPEEDLKSKAPDSGESRVAAAQIMDTNPRYVSDAKSIKSQSPEVASMVSEGNLTLPQAKIVAALPIEEQVEVVAELAANPDIPAKEIIDKHRPHVVNNSGENEWYTPSEYIEAARRVLGTIDLDPASSVKANETVRATKFYTKEFDGLDKDWVGRVWMNPPYSDGLMPKFAAKFVEEVKAKNVVEAIVLVNNATETQWFEQLVSVSSAISFSTGRIKFLGVDGLTKNSPLQGQAFIYFGNYTDIFTEEFSNFGWTCRL